MKANVMDKEHTIHKLIGWIILFSVTDAFFTHMGIHFNMVEEANPFAKVLYDQNILLFYGFKVILPILLFVAYPYIKSKKILNVASTICFIVYLLVNLYHLFWICLALYVG